MNIFRRDFLTEFVGMVAGVVGGLGLKTEKPVPVTPPKVKLPKAPLPEAPGYVTRYFALYYGRLPVTEFLKLPMGLIDISDAHNHKDVLIVRSRKHDGHVVNIWHRERVPSKTGTGFGYQFRPVYAEHAVRDSEGKSYHCFVVQTLKYNSALETEQYSRSVRTLIPVTNPTRYRHVVTYYRRTHGQINLAWEIASGQYDGTAADLRRKPQSRIA